MAKPKILIVDPDEKNLRLLAISLKKANFNVTITTDGKDALQKTESLKPDLIISETDLNSVSGFELLKTLRENPVFKDTPFIYLTRNKSVDEKVKGLKLGANDYLTKPIYLREIITRVKILLERVEQNKIGMGADRGFSGDLGKIGVVEVIQTLELANKTAIMHLAYIGHKGVIYFKKGKIVHSEVGKVKGEKAFYMMLNWFEGAFQVEFTEHNIIETITISNQGLLMEGLRRIDEWKQLQEIIPSLDTVLVIDSQAILSEHPEQFPSKVENFLAEFDGKKAIIDVIESLAIDEIEALKMVSQLYFQGFLVESSGPSDAKKVAYYYPTRAAANVEEKTGAQKEGKKWESEAQEFLKPPGEEMGEDTAFLMPPMDEEPLVEQRSDPPKPRTEPLPVLEAGEKKETKEKGVYIKNYPAPKNKQIAITETVSLKEQISSEKLLSNSEPQKPDLQQGTLAMTTARPDGSWLRLLLIISLVVFVFFIPIIIYFVPNLREEASGILKSFSGGDSSPALLPDAKMHLEVVKKLMQLGSADAFSNAEIELRSAMALQPEHPDVISDASAFYLEWGNASDKNALINKALSFAEDGLKRFPENNRLLFAKAKALGYLGRFSDAESIVNKLLQKDVNNPESYMLSAMVYINSNDKIDEAVKLFYKFLEISPPDNLTYIEFVEQLIKKNRLNDAEAVLKKINGIVSKDKRVLYMLGTVQEKNGKYKEAVNSFKILLEADKNNMDARIRIANLQIRNYDYNDAVYFLEDVLKGADISEDKILEAKYLLGKAYEGMKQTDKALNYYSAVISKQPDFRDAKDCYERLKPPVKKAQIEVPMVSPYEVALKNGRGYYKQGDLRNAVREFQKAAQLNPKSDEALVELGAVLFDLGEDVDAILKLTRAVTLNSKNSRALLLLGNIYYTRGENDKAVNYYKNFLKADPSGPYAEEIKTILNRLGR